MHRNVQQPSAVARVVLSDLLDLADWHKAAQLFCTGEKPAQVMHTAMHVQMVRELDGVLLVCLMPGRIGHWLGGGTAYCSASCHLAAQLS